MKFSVALPLLAAILSLQLVSADTVATYKFLNNTIWFVPTETLPAAVLDVKYSILSPVIDQTVWFIDGYKDGYYKGRVVTQLFIPGSNGTTAGPAQCLNLVGSITPDGKVLISFIDQGAISAKGATVGIGTLTKKNKVWRFLMQMSTGSSKLISHWSYMDRCPGEKAKCYSKLPGTWMGVKEFGALCGF